MTVPFFVRTKTPINYNSAQKNTHIKIALNTLAKEGLRGKKEVESVDGLKRENGIPISHLRSVLSFRAYTMLRKEGVFTVRDLLHKKNFNN
jgi:hypothetical protein